MKILHLCSNYPHKRLYRELVVSIAKLDIKQIVYVPIKHESDFNRNTIGTQENTELIYSKIFNDLDRVFYYRKINKIIDDMENKIDFKDVDLIHAHSLFSMGGIALRLKKERNIDYIVAIRSTDIHLFFKYMFHLRGFGFEIIKQAKKIIFINPSYKDLVIKKILPKELVDQVMNKSLVIPNGLDGFFLNNKFLKSGLNNKKDIKLLYVGSFLKRKNVHVTIAAAKKLQNIGYQIKLNIVGDAGGYSNRINSLSKMNKDFVETKGRIEDKNKLLNIYRSSDIFIMPSINETFGLVYLEAMSQGLPIIYSKNEGIAGCFENGKVGFSVDHRDMDDIVKKIEIIINNYDFYSKNCNDLVEEFSWNRIAKKYNQIYKS